MDVFTGVAINCIWMQIWWSKDNVRVGTDAGDRIVWLDNVLWKRFSGYHQPQKFLWLVISTDAISSMLKAFLIPDQLFRHQESFVL